MTNRLTRIYTRTGDDGTTGLADGTRLPKDHIRIEVLGCLDELNSQLGLVMVQAGVEQMNDLVAELALIQNRLFDMGAELAVPGTERIDADDAGRIEAMLDAHNGTLPPLKDFVLPGGGLAASHCHLARAVCRRAERRLVQFSSEERINPHTLHYINRLSDLLFVIARVLARRHGGTEILWQPGSNP